MFSVVIPLYNKEQTVARALRSVLGQTRQDFEIIVVNDGSTDGSVKEVENFQDRRIKIIHQSNAGVSAARNRGIHEANSEIIAFLDADDEWKPWFAETVSDLRKNFPDAGVWATNYEHALPGGVRWPTRLHGLPNTTWRGLIPDYFLLAARSHPPVHSSSVSVARAAISSIGGFPNGVRSGEDLLTWARLAAHFPIAYCTKPSSTFMVTASETNCLLPLSREPELEDVVGRELHKLESIVGECGKHSLRLYIARWKRIRAAMFARCGDLRHTIASSFHSFRLNPYEAIVWGFVGVAIFHYCRKLMLPLRSRNRESCPFE